MLKVNSTPSTVGEKRWSYQQYYKGYKDKDGRRNGTGENNWSGAKGLFMNNVRWGPGIESHANVHNDVGLWRGRQLVRLSWRPLAPSIVPEFMTNSSGRVIVEAHRILLRNTVENVGEVNNAVELLRQCGADNRVAVEKWNKLYPKHCTDVPSSLCNIDLFNRYYYNENIYELEEIDPSLDNKDMEIDDIPTYYAWNNSKIMVNMMKHSFKHDRHKDNSKFDIKSILSGPRTHFKPPGNHELGCRNLLMASYLGYVADVAHLVNESRIHPDISDVQGNSAVMYATCGDQPEIIHFLIQAGANINAYNDCCCTALGIALMRYICVGNEIPLSGMLQALLPPPLPPTQPMTEQKVFEWNITREQATLPLAGVMIKIPSKTRNLSSKKIKSLISIDQSTLRRKTEPLSSLPELTDEDNYTSSEEKELYNCLNQEFSIKVTDAFTFSNNSNPIPYLFDVNDMLKEIEANEEEKKQPEKNIKKVTSKILKDTIKTSKEAIQKDNLEEKESLSSIEKQKINALVFPISGRLSKIMLTILELLSNGANPRLVRCPQPAMMIAATSSNPELIRHLVHYGANVNEIYHQVLGFQIYDYSPLDVAVSRPFTRDNFNVIKALLECGADPRHRLLCKRDPLTNEVSPGPTLLHVALGRKTESDEEENLTNLLLYGTDPLIKCQNGEDVYENIFVFAKRTLVEMESTQNKSVSPPIGKQDAKTKKIEKPKKEEKLSTKSIGKMSVEEVEDYKQAIELVANCARLIYIRWLQAKLVKELIKVINKYKHRHWNIILKQFNGKMNIGLWLTPQRCIEICDILCTKKKKNYNDTIILKHLLCIVIFMSWQNYGKLHSDMVAAPNVTANLKDAIELDANRLLRQHKVVNSDMGSEISTWKFPYIKPELIKDNGFVCEKT
ncbi:unnamed protein product, partial [Brenthis ino]